MILAGVAVAGSAYFIFFRDRDDFIYLFSVGLIVLMITYVFQFQIDQLMIRGVPQKIDLPMQTMLLSTAPHYRTMSPNQRLLVDDRMKRWLIKKEFINQNEQDAPEDIKYILAYYAILLTLHQEKYNYDGLDRMVFYHHPFLTPQFPDDAHIVEVEITDGTLIISVPNLLKGHMEKGFYNIALHAMAVAYQHYYIKQPVQWPADIWEKLENISSIHRQRIEDYIGLPVEDPWPVAVHHQLTYQGCEIPEVLEILPQFSHV